MADTKNLGTNGFLARFEAQRDINQKFQDDLNECFVRLREIEKGNCSTGQRNEKAIQKLISDLKIIEENGTMIAKQNRENIQELRGEYKKIMDEFDSIRITIYKTMGAVGAITFILTLVVKYLPNIIKIF